MSAPNRYIRDAEQINYGFLSVRAVEVFKKLKSGDVLSADDDIILSRAITFLSQIADGAELISTGSYQGHNATASMSALNLAMGPLERLQTLIKDREISTFFRQIVEDLSLFVSSKAKPSPQEHELLQNVIAFFEALGASLLETIASEKPRLGGANEHQSVMHVHT